MSTPTVFVVKNQAGLFLNKQQEWVEGSDRQALYRTAHRDEAVNTVFEVSSKDIYLRAEVFACQVDSKGQPVTQSTDLLSEAALSTEDDAANDALPAPETSEVQDELLEPAVPETPAVSVESTDISA